ncbi:MAG: glycosyltransferase [Anaerolineae bacterium]|nr:glycosyltransferase [Anaerolineae bacterium]
MDTLICISHLGWDFVWQRPQHLMKRLSQHYNVIFAEEPITTPNVTVPTLDALPGKHAPNVTVVRLLQPVQEPYWVGHGHPLTQFNYTTLLRQFLKTTHVHDPLLWLYTPMASDFVESLPHKLLIVDVMDQLSAFKGAPRELIDREKGLLRQANLVFTGGASLYRDKLPLNENTYLFPSGVEIDHYAPAANRSAFPRPADLAGIEGPILGFFGVIDERMDLVLIDHIARACPNWHLVMLGPVAKISPEDLPQSPNIHYLGGKSYDELPAYLAHFDVALMPFALNEATRYISPTKTLEYMAAHKPIVSTPVHDVVELYGGVVRIADTPEAFVQQVSAALDEKASTRRAKEDDLLKRNTWDSITNRMHQLISEELARGTQLVGSAAEATV